MLNPALFCLSIQNNSGNQYIYYLLLVDKQTDKC